MGKVTGHTISEVHPSESPEFGCEFFRGSAGDKVIEWANPVWGERNKEVSPSVLTLVRIYTMNNTPVCDDESAWHTIRPIPVEMSSTILTVHTIEGQDHLDAEWGGVGLSSMGV